MKEFPNDFEFNEDCYLGVFVAFPQPGDLFFLDITLEKNGMVEVFHNVFDPNSSGIPIFLHQITGYRLIDVSVRRSPDSPLFTLSEVAIFITHGQDWFQNNNCEIARGYPDAVNGITWPVNYERNYFKNCEGTFLLTAPLSVGADFTFTVPVGQVWEIVSVSFHAVIDAAIHNRFAYINAINLFPAVILFGSNTSALVALDAVDVFFSPESQQNVAYPTFRESSFNPNVLMPGTTINIGLIGINAGDTLSNLYIIARRKLI